MVYCGYRHKSQYYVQTKLGKAIEKSEKDDSTQNFKLNVVNFFWRTWPK